jgi:hypothetical protein
MPARLTVLLIILVELASFTFFWLPTAKTVALLTIAATIFIASLINLKYGVYGAMIELIIGSKGHLLATTMAGVNISLRMAIFCAVMLATLILLLRKKNLSPIKKILTPGWLIFSAALIWGAVFGLLRGNNPTLVYQDFNAYLFFSYLAPFYIVLRDGHDVKEFWRIFSAAIFSMCAKTIILLFAFSHFINFTELYKWTRGTGWGEIVINENVVRVFSQSHIYALIGFVIFFFVLIQNRQFKNKKVAALSLLCMTTLIISLSRSMWIGLFAAAAFFLFYAIKQKWPAVKIAKACGFFIAITAISFGMIWSLIAFPYPKKPLEIGFNLQNRFNTSESAVVTRWEEIKPLSRAIANHPIIGSGFGTVVKFTNWDPRILAETQKNNNYATYAFEWGYFDILLKIGLLGLLVYLAIIFNIAKNLFLNQPALFLGLIALLSTHVFTPYINHPLGIGYIIVVLIMTKSQIQMSNTETDF